VLAADQDVQEGRFDHSPVANQGDGESFRIPRETRPKRGPGCIGTIQGAENRGYDETPLSGHNGGRNGSA